MSAARKLDWRNSRPDHRDKKFSTVRLRAADRPHPVSRISVNAIHGSLRPHFGPVYDQLQLGSCTGNAGAGVLGFLEIVELKLRLPLDQAPQVYVEKKFRDPSRLFIYQNELISQGLFGQDAGATMRDICKVAYGTGVCQEATWKYDPESFLVKPTQAAYDEAAKHKLTAYYAIETDADRRVCLANGFPFLTGVVVTQSMMDAADGVWRVPTQSDRVLGGHAIVITGWNDETRMYEFRNSWGAGWANGGYGHISYDFVNNPDLADDQWTFRRAAGQVAGAA